jgi:hypothetical protein
VRRTDTSKSVAQHRYSVFKQHTETLRRLKEFFPYHVINAMGDMSDVQRAIKRELRYQSSLELSEGTFSAVTKLPLASDLVRDSRQQLVSRLDDAWHNSNHVFESVLELIRGK